jgi:hypothetical protein
MVNRTKRPMMTPSRANVLRLLGRYPILGYQLTLLEVHKLLYFLQLSGEELGLQFTKGAYGPSANNLGHVLHCLEGHFTLGFGDRCNSPTTPIKLLPDALKQAEEFVASRWAEDSETAKRFDRVARLIEGFESPYGTELLASVHWVATDAEEQATDLDSVVRSVQGWNERKRRIMKPEHLRIAWERLKQTGWLE